MSFDSIIEAIQLVEKAQAMTLEMRSRDARAHLFNFAERQLELMHKILCEGRSPTDEEKSEISVGWMAIHEFEGGPLDDCAEALEEASGAFHSL